MFSTEQALSVLTHWARTLRNASISAPPTSRLTQTTSIRCTAIGTGLSGGAVFRIDRGNAGHDALPLPDSPQPSWALKAWPPAATVQHIEGIAATVRAAAPHCGLLAPAIARDDMNSSLLLAYGRYWELSRWIPGSPLPAIASAESLASGGEAIARVHAAMNPNAPVSVPALSIPNTPTRSVSADAMRPPVPRCIVDRISRIQSMTPLLARIAGQTRHQDELAARLAAQLTNEQPGEPASAFDCATLAKSLAEAAAWLVNQWPALAPALAARLRQHRLEHAELPSFYVLRDVHREHVLFAGNSLDDQRNVVRGILDYDAVGFDSPALDLARWAGDFDATSCAQNLSTVGSSVSAVGFGPSPLHAAVAGYRRIRPFSQCEWELAQTLVEANRLGGLANWLVWLLLENRRFSASARQIQGRISHLIASDSRTW